MKNIIRRYKVLSYRELNQDQKDQAINEYIQDYLEYTEWNHLSPNAKKAVKKAEDMQTPWFAGSYIWDYCKQEIENHLNKEYTLEIEVK